MRGRYLRAAVAAVVLGCALVTAQLATGASSGVRVLASGLNNPRGVTVGPDGAVYVANAGAAGRICIGKGQNAQCGGFTGSITKVVDGKAQRLSTGFLSIGGRDGSFSTGVDDVVVAPGGYVYAIETSLGRHVPPGVPAAAAVQSGKLLEIGPRARKHVVADVSNVEWTLNPDRSNVDSDPYSVAVDRSGLIVADAAANDLLRVHWDGSVSVLAVFPAQRFGKHVVQAVPTSVAVGPDGAYYVGELGGDGTPNGRSRIWRVMPGAAPTVWKSGFTAIVGLDFGPDGSAYVAELVKHGLAAAQKGDLGGAVIRVWPDGRRTELAPGRLTAVGGVGVSRDGKVYASTGAIFPGKGQLVRIQ